MENLYLKGWIVKRINDKKTNEIYSYEGIAD